MDFSALASLASGHVEARIIQTAVAMRLFDELAGGARSAPSLASLLNADARATELLLNGLVSLGLLDKQDECFTLNDISAQYLVTASPQYYGHMVLFETALWRSWEALEPAVRSGAPVRPPDMFQGDPRETERFILAMDSLVNARGDAQVVAETLDLTEVRDMLDVGPGPATYAIQLCRKYPLLKAKLFDLPGTLKITAQLVKKAGMQNRMQLIEGDYRYDPIPGRCQLVFLSNIIHSEGHEENLRLMANLYKCLDRGGRIVIKDHIMNGSLTGPRAGAVFSLLMLLTTRHGQCFSLQEVTGWLKAAGFDRTDRIPLPHPLTSALIVGYKP